MKQFVFVLALLCAATSAYAIDPTVWKSSYTTTADSAQSLCSSHLAVLHSVCISSPSATAGASVTILNSTDTAKTVSVIDAMARGCYTFDTVVVSTNTNALGYTTTGAAKVNIFYACY